MSQFDISGAQKLNGLACFWKGFKTKKLNLSMNQNAKICSTNFASLAYPLFQQVKCN